MANKKITILESWPGIKADLLELLSDTDAWIIARLKETHKTKKQAELAKIIDLMDSLHGLSHPHEH